VAVAVIGLVIVGAIPAALLARPRARLVVPPDPVPKVPAGGRTALVDD
jgi:hypothetical protein